MIRVLAFVAFVELLVACGGGLSADDKEDLVNASKLTSMADRYRDAASAPAALDRGAYCSLSAVLRDQHISAPDAGIACN